MNINKSLEIIKSLADSSRLKIMHVLLKKPYYVEELAALLNLGAPTISFHLKKLEQANLVRKEKEQYYVVFHINNVLLSATIKDLIQVEDNENDIQDERIVQYKKKVIRTYFKNGRLERLPSQEKKRKIILEEFAARFELNRKYTEHEVNDSIMESYEDYCTVRRELIDRKIMKRKDTYYWLIEKVESRIIESLNTQNKKDKKKMDRKAELKQAYKMNPRQGGVFQIKNLVNGKVFIGSGANAEGQINKYKFGLKLNSTDNVELQNEWNTYGAENFSFEILDYLKMKDDMTIKEYKTELTLLEEMWCEKLNVYGNKGYNIKKQPASGSSKK
jgi:Uncharacterized protein conserved in bacteria